MSKNKYFGKKQDTPQPVMVEREQIEKDLSDAVNLLNDPDGIAPGQVYEGVVVPDRPINQLGLKPGARLNPIVIEAPYTQTNDGWWFAIFEGEGSTGVKLYVDAEMLKTGKLRK
jgi:hypothetical protein